MNDERSIQATPEGYQCSSCRQSYPSLYWFKREARTGDELCLGCASAAPGGDFENVLPDPEPIEKQHDPNEWRRVLAIWAESLALIIYQEWEEEIAAGASSIDQWLGSGFSRMLLAAAAILVGGHLCFLIWRFAASWWRKGSNPLWRKP